MMEFDVCSLIERTAAERSRDFCAWVAACARNRERMQEIGEAAAAVAYQISIGGIGGAEMWMCVDSDEGCVRLQELLRPWARGVAWRSAANGKNVCYADFSDDLIVWIRVEEFE